MEAGVLDTRTRDSTSSQNKSLNEHIPRKLTPARKQLQQNSGGAFMDGDRAVSQQPPPRPTSGDVMHWIHPVTVPDHNYSKYPGSLDDGQAGSRTWKPLGMDRPGLTQAPEMTRFPRSTHTVSSAMDLQQNPDLRTSRSRFISPDERLQMEAGVIDTRTWDFTSPQNRSCKKRPAQKQKEKRKRLKQDDGRPYVDSAWAEEGQQPPPLPTLDDVMQWRRPTTVYDHSCPKHPGGLVDDQAGSGTWKTFGMDQPGLTQAQETISFPMMLHPSFREGDLPGLQTFGMDQPGLTQAQETISFPMMLRPSFREGDLPGLQTVRSRCTSQDERLQMEAGVLDTRTQDSTSPQNRGCKERPVHTLMKGKKPHQQHDGWAYVDSDWAEEGQQPPPLPTIDDVMQWTRPAPVHDHSNTICLGGLDDDQAGSGTWKPFGMERPGLTKVQETTRFPRLIQTISSELDLPQYPGREKVRSRCTSPDERPQMEAEVLDTRTRDSINPHIIRRKERHVLKQKEKRKRLRQDDGWVCVDGDWAEEGQQPPPLPTLDDVQHRRRPATVRDHSYPKHPGGLDERQAGSGSWRPFGMDRPGLNRGQEKMLSQSYPRHPQTAPVFSNPDPDSECPICLDVLHAGRETWKLKCGHYFHKECMNKWSKTCCPCTCPVCRAIAIVSRV